MKLLTRPEWRAFILIFLFSSVPVLGGVIRMVELAGGPAIAPINPRALTNPILVSLHILSSVLFCLIGSLQFFPTFRRGHFKAHRMLGRVVAITGIVSAATGLWMTHFFTFPQSLQGNVLYWVRIVLGGAMIALIIHAVIAIKARNIASHSSAMLRAYAIGQGASTQAVMGIVWIIITGGEVAGPLRDVVMISAWALNLLIAQWVIWKWLSAMPTKASPVQQ